MGEIKSTTIDDGDFECRVKDPDNIEFGCDVKFNSDWGGCYSTCVTRSQLEFMLEKMDEAKSNATFKSGDRVTYQECFGDKELIFVGMAESLEFNNNCIVIYDGKAVPVRFSGLAKVFAD